MLTINGKKRKSGKDDVSAWAKTLNIPDKAVQNSFEKMAGGLPAISNRIDISFLPPNKKEQYKDLVMTDAGK